MEVLQTERLALRHLGPDDAPFMLRLLNEPSWIQNIGDRGVRTVAEAERYIETGPVEMYKRPGLGLYLVSLRSNNERIGICGLLKREALDDVDLGFAFLPSAWGNGYAQESAAAAMSYGKSVLGLVRVVAIISRRNDASRRVLERLGFAFERTVHVGPGSEGLLLFGAAI